MRFIALLALLVLLVAPPAGNAAVFSYLNDPRDEPEEFLKAAANHPQAESLLHEIHRLSQRIYGREESLPATGWVGVQKLPSGLSLPAVFPRQAFYSGIMIPGAPPRPPMPWQQQRYYLIGDAGAIELIPDLRGGIGVVVFLLPVDDDFPRGLDARLEWDRTRFLRLRRQILTDLGEYTPWQLDRSRPSGWTMMPGATSLVEEFRLRLADWSRIEPARTRRLPDAHSPNGGKMLARTWTDGNGFRTREARRLNVGDSSSTFDWAQVLIEYMPSHPVACSYHFDGGPSVRWFDKDTGRRVREEWGQFHEGRWQASQWIWLAEDNKRLRTEFDRDDDGIPDHFTLHPSGADPVRMDMADSWAVNPELIPLQFSIPNQDAWRVHVVRVEQPEFTPTHWRRRTRAAATCVMGGAFVILLLWQVRKNTSAPK
ncbi:MAG: hypothetical protein U0791_24690 [Gemmataceae bacterium]